MAALTNPLNTLTQPITPLTSPQQQQQQNVAVLVVKFSEVTGLKPDVAQQCLEANNWDMDGAVNTLRNLKAQGKLDPNWFYQMKI